MSNKRNRLSAQNTRPTALFRFIVRHCKANLSLDIPRLAMFLKVSGAGSRKRLVSHVGDPHTFRQRLQVTLQEVAEPKGRACLAREQQIRRGRRCRRMVRALPASRTKPDVEFLLKSIANPDVGSATGRLRTRLNIILAQGE